VSLLFLLCGFDMRQSLFLAHVQVTLKRHVENANL
jgi:hypothetical protein